MFELAEQKGKNLLRQMGVSRLAGWIRPGTGSGPVVVPRSGERNQRHVALAGEVRPGLQWEWVHFELAALEVEQAPLAGGPRHWNCR
jgi:hypothetical protein